MKRSSNQECTAGCSDEKKRKSISYIQEIFPDACPNFIRLKYEELSTDHLITHMLENDYPRHMKIKPLTLQTFKPSTSTSGDEQLKLLIEIFPQADPDYLQMHCYELIDKPDELNEFISDTLENNDYPTRDEYLRRQKLSAQQKQYTTEFTVQHFLEVIPNPTNYFENHRVDQKWRYYVFHYLRNKYSYIRMSTLKNYQMFSKKSLVDICLELNALPRQLKSRRSRLPELLINVDSIPLLQQIAYIDHYDEIEGFIKNREQNRLMQIQIAREEGLLQTCNCCFDEEVLPSNIFECGNHCKFCQDCIKRSVEIQFGEGKILFSCLNQCDSSFSLLTLQAVLSPHLFSQISLKLQIKEVKEAGIENLEQCPYCNFAAIPNSADKHFQCLNPSCMKETCRTCKKPSHVPLQCNEVEPHEVKVRTLVEDKLTQSLIRKCWKCQMPFIKSDGCNKMKCVCGALTCYVCKQPVSDYKHFNGQGGDNHHLCPLFSDTDELHRSGLLKGATEARRSLPESSQVVNNLIANLDKHYAGNESHH